MARKQPARRTPDVIDADAEQTTAIGELLGAGTDEQLAAAAWPVIREFFKGLAGFFVTARSMEQSATRTLEMARSLKAPTTVDGDVALQAFIKDANADRKDIEAHWQITSTVYQFQRRLVAARERGAKQLEEAAGIAQRLHNTYAENERRRAAEEQDRLRREAEERERLRREAELAEMERQAVAREEASPDLSERETLFVDYMAGPYASVGDGQRAAQQAGFKDPLRTAARLLSSPKIQAAIKATRDAQAIRRQATARAAQPLDVQVETVRPNVARAAGAVDRSTHSAELVDARALIEACLIGGRGIPTDILTVDMVKLQEYARSLHERINLWPGCRYVKTVKTV